MDDQKTTEQSSLYENLEQMSTAELLQNINREDQKVAAIIEGIIPQIEAAVDCIYNQMAQGGRLFYIGSGTSGRLGIVDASECPPTYGVPHDLVVGLIAGGKGAIHKAIEFAEDSLTQGWEDLKSHQISEKDFVVGITASGYTPYVLGALEACKKEGIPTGGITCNENTPLERLADFPMVAVVGPEFVTGSTRMKAGTAQKLILNMISTSVMIRLGHVRGNKMVDMQLSNNKLLDRGSRMIVEQTDLPYHEARNYLMEYGSVRKAVEAVNNSKKA